MKTASNLLGCVITSACVWTVCSLYGALRRLLGTLFVAFRVSRFNTDAGLPACVISGTLERRLCWRVHAKQKPSPVPIL